MLRINQQYHPVEAEALACFELKLETVFEAYFRVVRERIVSLAGRDGTLPVTFWMCERDELLRLLSPIYEAGLRLGMELERSPRAALNTYINLNIRLQETIAQLACDTAQEITVNAARQVGELLNLGLNPSGLPDRLRDELRLGVLSDAQAVQMACQQASRVLAAGQLFTRRTAVIEVIPEPYFYEDRVCI
jgi:hypothetical protein